MYQKPQLKKIDDYLFVNGVKACRILPGDVIEFWDKDARRRKEQGLPRIQILDLVRAVAGASD